MKRSAKTPSKNPNVWSDDRLSLEYFSAYRELKNLIKVAEDIKANTYSGPIGYLNRDYLIDSILRARDHIFFLEGYITKRNNWYIKDDGKPRFELVKINRSPTFVRRKKEKTPEEIKAENEFDEKLRNCKTDDDLVKVLLEE